MQDLYATLGLDRSASAEDIKKAYKKAASFWRPDRNKHPDADTVTQRINEAYEVLSDPARRARYDATGKTDNEVDTIERDAESNIIEMFAQACSTNSRNPVAAVHDTLDRAKADIRAQITATESAILRLQKIRDRIKVSEGVVNILALATETKIAERETHADALKVGIKVVDAALRMISAYSYDEEPVSRPVFEPGAFIGIGDGFAHFFNPGT